MMLTRIPASITKSNFNSVCVIEDRYSIRIIISKEGRDNLNVLFQNCLTTTNDGDNSEWVKEDEWMDVSGWYNNIAEDEVSCPITYVFCVQPISLSWREVIYSTLFSLISSSQSKDDVGNPIMIFSFQFERGTQCVHPANQVSNSFRLNHQFRSQVKIEIPMHFRVLNLPLT
jgi:hypothetical protein